MGGVSGQLTFDIIATLLMKKGANKSGLTNRYKNILDKKFKLNPKTVNLVSETTNTMAYYGMSGAADGYINTYKMAIQEGFDPDVAHEVALGASWRQGAWYAATSIFVPQDMYNKIPWRIGNL